MKLSEIKLGTVVNLKTVNNATVMARRISTGANTLLVWNERSSDTSLGWPLESKVWFDQISEQYSDPSSWPSKYQYGYWFNDKDSEVTTLTSMKRVSDLQLGDIVNAQYMGPVKNGIVIGKHSSGDALIGWKDMDCESSDMSGVDSIVNQTTYPNTTYLYSVEAVREIHVKAKWISREEMAEVVDSSLTDNFGYQFMDHYRTSENKKETSDIKDMTFIIDQKVIEEIKGLVDEILKVEKKSPKTIGLEPKIQGLDINKHEGIRSEFWTYNEIVVKRQSKDKPSSFGSMIKQDAGAAAYRVASTQITRGIKAAILTLMKNKGSSLVSLTALSEMLETEWGTSLLAYVMGIGLQQTSFVKDARMAKMAEEMRVHGMSIAGNIALEELMKYMMPVITESLIGLSKQEGVRIAPPPIPKVIELDENDLIEEPNETLHFQSVQT